MISPATIEAVRAATSLVELAQEAGLKLQSASGGYLALCPFHSERTPSFRIHTKGDRCNSYKCFGCGARGDTVSFSALILGYTLPRDYARTIEHLAHRAGISITGKPVSRVQRAADKEDAQMFPWWARNRQELPRRLLDSLLTDGPPLDRDDWDFACCLGRLARYAWTLAEFQCLVTSAERRAWRADVAFDRELAECWLGLGRVA